jgi:serine beta-lactamase-like protein LACTB
MNRNTHRLRHGRPRKFAATLVLLLALLPAAIPAVAQTGKFSNERQTKTKSAIAKFMATYKVPGVSVAVVLDGKFAWSAGLGKADLENSVAATSQTLYRLGSISKPITATAAMTLWERGKLELDVPVQKYCSVFPQKPWPITTRELLGHLAGIRYYNVPELPYSKSETDPEVGNTHHFENGIEAGLKFFANDPLVAQPGTHFNYSTQGYTLIGCAIEGASGKKYEDYVRENILIPAAMLHTRPDDRFAIIPLRTRFYSRDKSGAVINADFLDSSYKVPGGGWLSSAEDMARFEVAILNNRLLKRSTLDVMWTPQMPSDGLGRTVYGLGWEAGTTEGVRDVGHGGSQQGTSTKILIAPDAQAGVVVLMNSDTVGASELASQLLAIALGVSPKDPREITIDPNLYKGYIGTYQMNDFRMTIVRDDDRLFAELNNQKLQLFPEGLYDFFFKAFDLQITFVTDKTGGVKELVMHEGGTDTRLNRIK